MHDVMKKKQLTEALWYWCKHILLLCTEDATDYSSSLTIN